MKNPFKFEMAIISSGNNPVQESGDARLKIDRLLNSVINRIKIRCFIRYKL